MVKSGWGHNTFKGLFGFFAAVINTWTRLLALGLQAESDIVKHIPAEEDTQGVSFSPLERRHSQVKHQNREVTLRHATSTKEHEAWHLAQLQEPTGNSFIEETFSDGPFGSRPWIGFCMNRVEGRFFKDMLPELPSGVNS